VVEYVHFPLHPDTPTQGKPLADLFGGAQGRERLQASQQRLKALAQAEGLPYGDRTMTYNSRLAQEAGKWAESKGKGREFHDAVFRAYFVAGRDISNANVLADLARSAGLDAKEAARVVKERSFQEAIDRDWVRCARVGVDAVPTFEAGGEFVVGAQPYEQLEELVRKAGAKKRR
jgi:predicted DsbA family dithiol-disulfide isomerase